MTKNRFHTYPTEKYKNKNPELLCLNCLGMSNSELCLVKISNSEVLHEFLHECVDDLVEKQKANFNNYSNGDINWTKEDFEKARKYIQNVYRQNVLEGNLELIVDLPSNIKAAMKQCYEIRKTDIFQALAKEFILKNGHNLVENIDWRLKWILGTSVLATLREPILQIDLNCSRIEKNKPEKNIVNFEVNLEQADNLIDELRKLKKELA